MLDRNRVVFYSKESLARGYELQKGESILRAETKQKYTDINDILELYNLKKYIEQEVYLSTWTQADIDDFKRKAAAYDKIVKGFMVAHTKTDFKTVCRTVQLCYVGSFLELIDILNLFNSIPQKDLRNVLDEKLFVIKELLQRKRLVLRFSSVIKDFLLTHPESAELLLSFYEIKEDGAKEKYHFPKCLSVKDKETIIINYLDSGKANFNYLPIIQNAKNRDDFRISDRTRLKAYRLYRTECEKLFKANGIKYGVSVSFPDKVPGIKEGKIKEGFTVEYKYSLDYIKTHNNPHELFENFIYLFEFVDHHGRIELVNKKSSLEVIEKFLGLHSATEYIQGIGFNISEMRSQVQIEGYIKVLEGMGLALESVLQQMFCKVFHEEYGFAENAQLYMPVCTSYFEKVRVLSPELESILKQYKLFVEDGFIDFELLQISSSPTTVGDIPSLNLNKYVYLSNQNAELSNIIHLFFSDQTLLGYVEPYREKHYSTLFDVLANEDVAFDKYEDFQKPALNYLIKEKYLFVDCTGNIQFVNPYRINILHDLFKYEVGAYHWYPKPYQQEVQKMATEGLAYFENTLFSKPEQDYFNFFLNKSAFTNGLDLRNKYAHGTQANVEEIEEHKFAYQTYLRLIVLALLKIEDDLMIHKSLTAANT